MDKRRSRQQAVDILGWIFGWYNKTTQRTKYYIVPDGFQIHHIDGDPFNNSLDNLVILTAEEHWKIHEEERNERLRKNGKKISKPILCVETGVFYKSIKEASRDIGVSDMRIRKVCGHNRKTAGGYHWQYVEE